MSDEQTPRRCPDSGAACRQNCGAVTCEIIKDYEEEAAYEAAMRRVAAVQAAAWRRA